MYKSKIEFFDYYKMELVSLSGNVYVFLITEYCSLDVILAHAVEIKKSTKNSLRRLPQYYVTEMLLIMNLPAICYDITNFPFVSATASNEMTAFNSAIS